MMTKAKIGGTGLTLADLPPKVKEAFAALTNQERRFVVAYCDETNGNGSLAVVIAGFCKPTDTRPARGSKSSRLTKNPLIRAAIEAWNSEYGMSGVEVTARMKMLSQITPFPFYEVGTDGKLKMKEKISQTTWEKYAPWVKTVLTNDEGVVIGLVLHDSFAALKEQAKINKLYSDAPVFHFHAHLERLTDEELLRQYQEALSEEDYSGPPLLAGGQVAEIPAPPTEKP
jgi:hypothetical protein